MLTNQSSRVINTPTKALGKDFARLDFASTKLDFEFDQVESEAADEPLLKLNNKRFVLFPIQYQKIWAAYKNAEAKFWSAEEIEFFEDADDWKNVNNKERACILHALAVMSVNDTLAGDEPIIS
ncbi:UNVERIFIED_CONTAM: Ribonucleotide-diphosphate reductase (RNR), small subunit, partial [Siphonaria sp. JEL0065]